MKTLFNNLINGNLKEAKLQARAYGRANLAGHARNYLGFSLAKSILAAMYLKGDDVWQKYCDAK